MGTSGTVTAGRIVLLTGGLGGARLAPALASRCGRRLTVVANVGDDLTWRTLRVCPDVDTVLYSLAGVWDAERGWGRREESWGVRTELERRGDEAWFNVGDRDIALHLRRSELLATGATLTAATRRLAAELAVGVDLLPAADEPAATSIELVDGRILPFQEWYVREHAAPWVKTVHLSGAPASAAVLAAIAAADLVVLGPSNPVSSIGAILTLGGVRDALRTSGRVVAVSPVVCGAGTDDPGVAHHARARERLLGSIGRRDTPASIAGTYADLCDAFVLDHVDAGDADGVERAGLHPIFSSTLDPDDLAATLGDLVARVPTTP